MGALGSWSFRPFAAESKHRQQLALDICVFTDTDIDRDRERETDTHKESMKMQPLLIFLSLHFLAAHLVLVSASASALSVCVCVCLCLCLCLCVFVCLPILSARCRINLLATLCLAKVASRLRGAASHAPKASLNLLSTISHLQTLLLNHLLQMKMQ